MKPITIRYPILPRRRSLATNQLSDLFGLAEDEPAITIADQLLLDIQPGNLVLFTGPSGSGKSSIMRAASEQLSAVDAMQIDLEEKPLIDSLPGPLTDRLDWLSTCGLAEARLGLRYPSELSDGQRYRFRLAKTFSEAQQRSPGSFILADEFAAFLDRTLAKVLAFNVRRFVDRNQIGALLATTHEDIVADLNPDLWVRCHGEGRIEVIDSRKDPDHAGVKKKLSASPTICGSPKAPVPTGRTLLGGIIARTNSASSNGS